MTWYILDTNHLSAFLDEQPLVASRIKQRIIAGDRLGITLPILCEYRAGIARGSRFQRNLARLQKAMQALRFWPTDELTAAEFASITTELRMAGRILPAFDTLIAASARQLGLTLLTSDGDFNGLPRLRLENWLV